jgi:hypothetical protein
MDEIADKRRERLERRIRWAKLEIERLERMARLGALDRSDVDYRVTELQGEIAALEKRLDHANDYEGSDGGPLPASSKSS